MSITAAPRRHQQVLADDGCPITVRLLHEGAGEIPVLFVHALAMNGEMWRPVSEALRYDAPHYAIDCRGHGSSGRPAGPYCTARFVQDIVCVLNHLGTARVHLVGCSMGGTVALAFAGVAADRLASLTVVDTTACYGKDAHVEWDERALRPQKEGFAAMVPFQISRWFSDDFVTREPALVEEAVRVFLANDPDAYAHSCRMLGRADERASLGRYPGPACVLVGQHDYATPVSMAKEAVSLLRQGELVVLPGRRHYTPIESPEDVAAAVLATINRQ